MSAFSGFGILGINIVLPILFVLGFILYFIGWLLDRHHDNKMKRDAMKDMSKEEAELYSLTDRQLIRRAKEQIKHNTKKITE
jgi:Na+-transporting methylmalonyl-CoA/oxaloacetate decarboxylase gamma subunit